MEESLLEKYNQCERGERGERGRSTDKTTSPQQGELTYLNDKARWNKYISWECRGIESYQSVSRFLIVGVSVPLCAQWYMVCAGFCFEDIVQSLCHAFSPLKQFSLFYCCSYSTVLVPCI